MAKRILTQVNFSAGYNPEGDSGLHFICGIINALIRKRDDYHFYIMVPREHINVWGKFLNSKRVTLIPLNLASRTQGGSFQFCPNEIKKEINFREIEIDFLLINQPETANAFMHYLNKQLFHDIPTISYLHWFDNRGYSSKKDTHDHALLSALSGMLLSEVVGCNSKYSKKSIISVANRWFNTPSIQKLEDKIRVLPPGIDTNELDINHSKRVDNEYSKIIINHRVLNYTGVRSLLSDIFPKFWEMRQDFRVTVTNPSRVRLPKKITQVPWLNMVQLDRGEYFRALWEHEIVVSPHQATNWSISTLEAIYSGCVPIMNRNSFFPEMMNPILDSIQSDDRDHIKGNWFYSDDELLDKLSTLIDNYENERELIEKIRPIVKSTYSWSNLINDWVEMFQKLLKNAHKISLSNPSFERISQMIEEDGGISKREILRRFNWGPQSSILSWSAFRRRLLIEYYDNSMNSKVIYKQIDQS